MVGRRKGGDVGVRVREKEITKFEKLKSLQKEVGGIVRSLTS